jgi:Fe-S-cluster-containing dehydrogenase component
MTQLGFVIDHQKCIGCHACTVACKAENHVPLGKFRTWVKYTEAGQFPAVKRSFAVLRCNQCSDAPCMTICPTSALFKRKDGIVDLDSAACIGCKSCMQACPYDALYIDEEHGTAEKCHFCAHRTELGLAPACAVVCPTEAIIPGDFDDPESVVSKLKARGDLSARKVEAGTRPNVLYKETHAAGLTPSITNAGGGYLWANQIPGDPLDAERFLAEAEEHSSRTVYDVDHKVWWGARVSAYLLTKSLSAGLPLAALLTFDASSGRLAPGLGWLAPLIALLFLAITGLLLVTDLKRPDRVLLMLTRPNWSSWLIKGSLALLAHGAAQGAWLVIGFLQLTPGPALGAALAGFSALSALAAAAYTAWLFRQAKGRVLWMKRGLELDLIFQALLAGSSAAACLAPALGLAVAPFGWLALAAALGLLAIAQVEQHLSPAGREIEYRRALSLLQRGPFASAHRAGLVGLLASAGLGLGLALLAPGMLLGTGLGFALAGVAFTALALLETSFVRAGQALPIS